MRVTLAAALCLAALFALGCGGSDGEGTLTLYSGRQPALIGPLIDRYEEEHGIDVETRFGDTAELAATIREEGDNSPADLFFAQDAGALGALEDEGLLAPLPRTVLGAVDSRYRSRRGRWVGTSARARVVAYNKEELSEAELPESILGFTASTWRGRIGWAPTNGSFQAFVTALRLLEGEQRARDWLEGIVDNDPHVYENNSAIRDAIAAGEIDVGFINHYYVAQAVAERGRDYPVGVYFPPGGDPGSLVNVAGVGLLESSERRAEALRFTRFLLSREGQVFFSRSSREYAIAAGVKSDPSLVPLDRIEQPDIDLSDLDDLQGTLELLEQTGAL